MAKTLMPRPLESDLEARIVWLESSLGMVSTLPPSADISVYGTLYAVFESYERILRSYMPQGITASSVCAIESVLPDVMRLEKSAMDSGDVVHQWVAGLFVSIFTLRVMQTIYDNDVVTQQDLLLRCLALYQAVLCQKIDA